MTSEELHARWMARPFHPFRVVMKDGKTYDVTHPRYVIVGRGFWNFYYQTSPDEPYDDVDRLSPDYVDHVEDLPDAVVPPSKIGTD
jgi:hypothetical protein